MARTALLEERRPDTWAGGDGNGSQRVNGSDAASGSQRAHSSRSQAHTTDPEQDTGAWTPVSMQLTQAWSRGRRPLAVTAMLAVIAALATVLTAATLQRVPTITVPSVSGQPITTAGQLLARAGFEVRERTQPNRSVKAGIVLAQDPAAGMRMERGTLVTLTVSTGPAAVTVDPADYLGQPLDNVRGALIRLGLRVTVETAPASGDPGTVVAIAPAGALRQGDTVAITVASPRESSASAVGAVPGGDRSVPVRQEGDKKVDKHRHDNGHGKHH